MSERTERPPTLKQERLAAIYVEGNPNTHIEALEQAGYSPRTARASALIIREGVGTQRAIEKHRAKQSDNARDLLRISTGKLVEYVRTSKDPDHDLKSMVAAATVLEKVGDDGTSADDKEHVVTVKHRIARAFALGRLWALRHPSEQFEIPARIPMVRGKAASRSTIVNGTVIYGDGDD